MTDEKNEPRELTLADCDMTPGKQRAVDLGNSLIAHRRAADEAHAQAVAANAIARTFAPRPWYVRLWRWLVRRTI